VNLSNISFGSTEAIISSMAIIVGLGSIHNGRASLIAALLVIAVADNITDTFSMHIYHESNSEMNLSKIVPLTNFLARLIVAFSFVFIVLIFSPMIAKIIGVIWGMSLLISLSFLIVRSKKINVTKEISYHVLLALFVIVVSQLLGSTINQFVK
jgi:hypothetical protein